MRNRSERCHADKKGSLVTVVIVYVDDIVLVEMTVEVQSLKKYLEKEFAMKDLGESKYVLGIEIARSRKEVVICRGEYMKKQEVC